MSFKPDAYTSVAPYLVVDGAQATLDFLVRVFDATPLRRYARDDGTLLHAEARIDDTVLMLSEATAGWPAVAAHVHVYVADVDATYQRAIAAGATPVKAPAQGDDEDRRGGFTDAGGTTWWVGTQVT
ncbi:MULTISPECIES: VOC family protein [Luteimonas]|uniref:VOC family protein n=1 Tax=Luteimonas TaxID=83614 RepID=UPI000C7ABD1D|nr:MULTISPECIES: VOC family protein [Luteimonas]